MIDVNSPFVFLLIGLGLGLLTYAATISRR